MRTVKTAVVAFVLGLVGAFGGLVAPAGAAGPGAAGAGTTADPAIAVPAPPAFLKSRVVVSGDIVTLGDLFENAGAYADRPVLQAPAPGRRTSVDAIWLYKVARTYGLAWRPMSRSERAIIERDARTISEDTIVEAIREALIRQGMSRDTGIAVANRNLSLTVAADARAEVAIEDLEVDEAQARFACTVVAPAGAPDAVRVKVQGRMTAVTEIPVLARTVRKGDMITDGDIAWLKVPVDAVGQRSLTDAADLIGRMATRSLREGQPVRGEDVQAPIVLAKNKIVTILFTTPLLSLTAQGRSLEDGAVGESIRVQNAASRKVLQARVIDADTVAVDDGFNRAVVN